MKVELIMDGFGTVAHSNVKNLDEANRCADMFNNIFNVGALKQRGADVSIVIADVPSKMNKKGFVIADDK